MLHLSVIGNKAFLAVHSMGEAGEPSNEPLCALQVRARSLLLALQAALEDDQRGSEA